MLVFILLGWVPWPLLLALAVVMWLTVVELLDRRPVEAGISSALLGHRDGAETHAQTRGHVAMGGGRHQDLQ